MAVGPEVGAFRAYYVLPNTVMMGLVIVAVILTFVAFFSYIPNVVKQFAQKYGWGKNKTK